jgi:hypothetical protein
MLVNAMSQNTMPNFTDRTSVICKVKLTVCKVNRTHVAMMSHQRREDIHSVFSMRRRQKWRSTRLNDPVMTIVVVQRSPPEL